MPLSKGKELDVKRRDRKIVFDVMGQGRRGAYRARTPGHAVKQFRRQFGLSFRTDSETGGWKGLSIEPRRQTTRRSLVP